MKYIMYDGNLPVCFPNELHHKDVSQFINSMLFDRLAITSAGDFIVHNADGEVEVELTGGSDTLGLNTAYDDDKILLKALRERAPE